jgi:putative tricarboxylic transport membrane protein
MHRPAALIVAALIAGLPSAATAQDYPTRTVTIIVPFQAGGPLDTIARTLTPILTEKLGQPFIVENVSGAGTTIGSLRAARATPDGHTLLLQNLALAASGTLYPQTEINPEAMFSTVIFVASNALVLVGRKSLAPSSLADLVAWMRNNRATVSHAGTGTTGHMTSIVFARVIGAQIDLVPYRGGGPALQDVLAGHVDLFIATPQAAIELIRSDQIKAFGITAKESLPQLPQVSSMATEIGPDLEVLFWTALFAPVGTPKPVLAKIAAVVDQALSSDAMIKAWTASGMQVYPKSSRTPEAGDAIFRAEVKRWSALVRENNIKAD